MRTFSLALLTLLCGAALPSALAHADEPSHLIAAQRIKWYPAWYFRLARTFTELPGDVPIHTGASLYRLTYWTRDWNGAPVQASGLLALPHHRPMRGIVSYQHGTTTLREQVPSYASVDGRVAAAAFAGARYLLLAPDYLGLGESNGIHPYLHADSAANAGIDLIRAAYEFTRDKGIDWPPQLNLLGFSEGGHATAAMQRRIEAEGVPGTSIVAAATAAAPFDLANVSFPFALGGTAKSHAVYLGYMVRAYAQIYGQPLGSVLEPPFDTAVVTLFDGAHDDDAIKAVLPSDPRAMFLPAFLAAFDAGEPTWLSRALAANEVFDWAPAAPLRLYYGTADTDVAARDSIAAAAAMKALDGHVQAINVGPLDHEESAFEAVWHIRFWFDALNPLPD